MTAALLTRGPAVGAGIRPAPGPGLARPGAELDRRWLDEALEALFGAEAAECLVCGEPVDVEGERVECRACGSALEPGTVVDRGQLTLV
jgi:hypothetical protein